MAEIDRASINESLNKMLTCRSIFELSGSYIAFSKLNTLNLSAPHSLRGAAIQSLIMHRANLLAGLLPPLKARGGRLAKSTPPDETTVDSPNSIHPNYNHMQIIQRIDPTQSQC
jgi:hypothetical protein